MVPERKHDWNFTNDGINMVRAMCGVQLKIEESSKDLMLSLIETIDQLAMVTVFVVMSCVEERGWSRLGRALDL